MRKVYLYQPNFLLILNLSAGHSSINNVNTHQLPPIAILVSPASTTPSHQTFWHRAILHRFRSIHFDEVSWSPLPKRICVHKVRANLEWEWCPRLAGKWWDNGSGSPGFMDLSSGQYAYSRTKQRPPITQPHDDHEEGPSNPQNTREKRQKTVISNRDRLTKWSIDKSPNHNTTWWLWSICNYKNLITNRFFETKKNPEVHRYDM